MDDPHLFINLLKLNLTDISINKISSKIVHLL